MFVLYVIFSMSLLAKIGATHRALELRLAVLRLIFLNVIDKYLSGLTCKLRNCRYTAKCKHANNNTTPTFGYNTNNTCQLSRNALLGKCGVLG